MTNGKESRRDPRAKVLSMTVRYKSATVAEFIENHSYDVSRGGIFIKTPSPFPPGTLLKFEVRIAEEQKVMMGVGRVTWKRDVETGPDKPAGMGVKFIKLDDESTRLIGELVDARESVEASFEEGARESGVKVSVPPPAAPKTASNPDQSVIAHTADILRSAVDATRSHATKSEAEEDDRATLPNSGPVSSLRKPSAPPRPQSKLPSPAPGAPQKEGKEDQPAPDAGSPSAEPNASTEATAAVEAASEDEQSAAAETSSGTTSDVADAERKPISELITTPPRRSQSGSAEPAPKTSPLLWVILVVGVLLAGYYIFIRKGQEPAGLLPDEATPAQPTEVAEVPTPPEPPAVVPAPTEASEASADALSAAPAASEEPPPAATEEVPEPAESVEAEPAKPAPKPRPARPKPPAAPTAPAASNPPSTPAPPAPEAPAGDPAPPAAPPPAAPPPAAPPPAAPPPAAPAPTAG